MVSNLAGRGLPRLSPGRRLLVAVIAAALLSLPTAAQVGEPEITNIAGEPVGSATCAGEIEPLTGDFMNEDEAIWPVIVLALVAIAAISTAVYVWYVNDEPAGTPPPSEAAWRFSCELSNMVFLAQGEGGLGTRFVHLDWDTPDGETVRVSTCNYTPPHLKSCNATSAAGPLGADGASGRAQFDDDTGGYPGIPDTADVCVTPTASAVGEPQVEGTGPVVSAAWADFNPAEYCFGDIPIEWSQSRGSDS